MNRKEISEIRRRFRPERNSITHIYGCYVNSCKEIISYIDESVALMSAEENVIILSSTIITTSCSMKIKYSAACGPHCFSF